MKYYLMAFNHRLDGARLRREFSIYEQAYFEYVRHQGKVDNLVMYEIVDGRRTVRNKG